MALFQGNIFPKTLGFETQVYVSLPYDGHRYQKDGPSRTLILLHGISDNASGWIRHGLADELAAQYNIAVIVPEGHKSFWLDMKHGGHYTEYLTGELPELMEKMFHIPADSDHLMIAGLSMGGFGALHAALSEPGVFAAVGSFSGVTDISAFFHQAEILGKTSDCGANFINEIVAVVGEGGIPREKDQLCYLAKNLSTAEAPDIYLACGTEDLLVYRQNTAFYDLLCKCHLDVVYETWEGIHDWVFWRSALNRFLEHVAGKPEDDDVFGGIIPYKK
ncbi:prolyl oligopeptidase family serine peptidase [Ruminococcus sp. OA3]|uniref:alpha/beta hydrolase n=1 Tax=Ruminococcus sp. OA3 TaxID=2914164 RepID=UPI001F05A73E|nr:alpha/beta hydrolase-fold protein [Ruminococcus sp. OA3]MCH1981520.1 prolyl oligopeptidase family serine peptidase [Ruminococcus sp. OA3]